MAKFLQKPLNMAKNCHNLFYLVLNHKLGLKNKNCQTIIKDGKKTVTKNKKPQDVTTSKVFLNQKGPK